MQPFQPASQGTELASLLPTGDNGVAVTASCPTSASLHPWVYTSRHSPTPQPPPPTAGRTSPHAGLPGRHHAPGGPARSTGGATWRHRPSYTSRHSLPPGALRIGAPTVLWGCTLPFCCRTPSTPMIPTTPRGAHLQVLPLVPAVPPPRCRGAFPTSSLTATTLPRSRAYTPSPTSPPVCAPALARRLILFFRDSGQTVRTGQPTAHAALVLFPRWILRKDGWHVPAARRRGQPAAPTPSGQYSTIRRRRHPGLEAFGGDWDGLHTAFLEAAAIKRVPGKNALLCRQERGLAKVSVNACSSGMTANSDTSVVEPDAAKAAAVLDPLHPHHGLLADAERAQLEALLAGTTPFAANSKFNRGRTAIPKMGRRRRRGKEGSI